MPMYSNESTSGPKPQFEMDKEAEDRFCRFVDGMPLNVADSQKPDGMVRLFDRGDYYSAHGADAVLIAHQVYKTTNVIKYLGSGISAHPSKSNSAITAKGLPSVTISMALTKAFLREALTTKQMRVEIYEPIEGQGGRKNNTAWKISKEASPGNIGALEDLLFDRDDLVSNAVSMAIRVTVKEGVRTVGCAFVDVQEKTVGVSQFDETENFSNTESLLIQLGIKECLIQADDKKADHELTKLKTLVERCNVIVTERRAADFQAKNVEQDLNRLLDESHAGAALPEFELKQAMSALNALLIYLSLPSDPSLIGQLRLYRHDLSQYMKLDASAVKALNLVPGPNELGGNKNMSLYGLLNRCKTAQGKRLLERWLKQPLVNLHEISQRQGIVEAFYDDTVSRRKIQDEVLSRMPDFHRISKKFHRGTASLDDVVRVYQAVQRLPVLSTSLEGINTPTYANKELINTIFLKPLAEHIQSLDPYTQLVEDTIELDDIHHGRTVLKATLDGDLEALQQDLVRVRDLLDDEHDRVARDLGVEKNKKLHLENHQVYHYSLRITKAEAGATRGKKGYIDLTTQKSGSIFTTRILRQLSDQYLDLQKKYETLQNSLVKKVVEIAATYCPLFELLDGLIAAIDVSISFAQVASASQEGYIRPKLFEKGTGNIKVVGARHPCLEVQDDMFFVPNDHMMDKESSEFIILTGPNMGGKSTFIRQIGVIALMAQIGCFVPATEAELPIFDCILARVGAGDSQLKGVSTFMAEMLETANIMKSATKDSLIIIDELGRGTSTYDGFGLAWAISEHIATEIRCFCLFATHFHELTILDQTLPHVKNLHVRAQVTPRNTDGTVSKENDITLLYQVKEGICDQSFGIHVAELANFPEKVVNLAKRKAEELEDFGGEPDDRLSKYTKEETDEGTDLIREFLDTWKSRVEALAEGEGEGGVDEERQVELLREVAKEYGGRLDSNKWVGGLIAGL